MPPSPLLAPDVVFRSPIVHKPYQGPEAVRALLEGVLAIFEDFRYERSIGAPDAADHALVFRHPRRRPRDRGLRLPARQRRRILIDEFVVMVRPLTGALALAEAMRAALRGLRTGALGARRRQGSGQSCTGSFACMCSR